MWLETNNCWHLEDLMKRVQIQSSTNVRENQLIFLIQYQFCYVTVLSCEKKKYMITVKTNHVFFCLQLINTFWFLIG